MISKKTALKEAGRFAWALDGPLGPRPMQPVVEQFLEFFIDLRRSGANWPQIANLLFAAGARTRSGKPVSASVLRSIVSRAMRRKKMQSNKPVTVMIEQTGPGPQIRSRASTRGTPSLASRTAQQSTPHTDVAARIRRAAELRQERNGTGGRRG